MKKKDPTSHRIIEKRRRDRMNNCLADLSKLIPVHYMKKGRGRIEKTEIIEMAIRHLKDLIELSKQQQQQPPLHVQQNQNQDDSNHPNSSHQHQYNQSNTNTRYNKPPTPNCTSASSGGRSSDGCHTNCSPTVHPNTAINYFGMTPSPATGAPVSTPPQATQSSEQQIAPYPRCSNSVMNCNKDLQQHQQVSLGLVNGFQPCVSGTGARHMNGYLDHARHHQSIKTANTTVRMVQIHSHPSASSSTPHQQHHHHHPQQHLHHYHSSHSCAAANGATTNQLVVGSSNGGGVCCSRGSSHVRQYRNSPGSSSSSLSSSSSSSGSDSSSSECSCVGTKLGSLDDKTNFRGHHHHHHYRSASSRYATSGHEGNSDSNNGISCKQRRSSESNSQANISSPSSSSSSSSSSPSSSNSSSSSSSFSSTMAWYKKAWLVRSISRSPPHR